jgi:hypothetical protein
MIVSVVHPFLFSANSLQMRICSPTSRQSRLRRWTLSYVLWSHSTTYSTSWMHSLDDCGHDEISKLYRLCKMYSCGCTARRSSPMRRSSLDWVHYWKRNVTRAQEYWSCLPLRWVLWALYVILCSLVQRAYIRLVLVVFLRVPADLNVSIGKRSDNPSCCRARQLSLLRLLLFSALSTIDTSNVVRFHPVLTSSHRRTCLPAMTSVLVLLPNCLLDAFNALILFQPPYRNHRDHVLVIGGRFL